MFAENRNDYNWLRNQDWTSGLGFGYVELQNLLAPLLDTNPSLGITEVSVGVAAMMDNPGLVPSNYGEMSWEERAKVQNDIARGLSKDQRQRIISALSDPKVSIEYSAKYLRFLGQHRDYGGNLALWLSDYNRGLSDWDTTSPYGRRIDVYRANLLHALNFQPRTLPPYNDSDAYILYVDLLLYGELP